MLELFNIPHLITTYGYVGISIIVFLESGIFFPLPGDSLLFTAGLLASTSYLKLHTLIPIIFISTFLGGMVGYYIGTYLHSLRTYPILGRFLKDEYLEEAHKFFDKYGKYAIVLSRFVPVVRTFTPIAAGVAKMPYQSFIKYNLISSVIWSVGVTSVGYFLGKIFPKIQDYLSYMIILIVLASVVPILLEYLKKRKLKKVILEDIATQETREL